MNNFDVKGALDHLEDHQMFEDEIIEIISYNDEANFDLLSSGNLIRSVRVVDATVIAVNHTAVTLSVVVSYEERIPSGCCNISNSAGRYQATLKMVVDRVRGTGTFENLLIAPSPERSTVDEF